MFKKAPAKEQISSMEYAKALVKAELLQEENNRLHVQVDRLQEALVAATAPRAYDAIQRDKANQLELTLTPAQEKLKKDKEEEQEFLKDYLENMEKPVFADADDLISSLSKLIGITTPEPMHSNLES